MFYFLKLRGGIQIICHEIIYGLDAPKDGNPVIFTDGIVGFKVGRHLVDVFSMAVLMSDIYEIRESENVDLETHKWNLIYKDGTFRVNLSYVRP